MKVVHNVKDWLKAVKEAKNGEKILFDELGIIGGEEDARKYE